MVNKFKAATHLDPKADWPWCAAFVSFCCQELQAEQPNFARVPHEASVAMMWEWAVKNALRFPEGSPNYNAQRGDIVVFTFSHVGIISKPLPGGLLYRTVEGNTNDEGSREGYEVAYRNRHASSVRGFIRLAPRAELAA